MERLTLNQPKRFYTLMANTGSSVDELLNQSTFVVLSEKAQDQVFFLSLNIY